MNVMREKAHQIKDENINFRRDLQKHQEASFQEFRTTDKVAAALDELGVSYRRLEPPALSPRSASRAKQWRCGRIWTL